MPFRVKHLRIMRILRCTCRYTCRYKLNKTPDPVSMFKYTKLVIIWEQTFRQERNQIEFWGLLKPITTLKVCDDVFCSIWCHTKALAIKAYQSSRRNVQTNTLKELWTFCAKVQYSINQRRVKFSIYFIDIVAVSLHTIQSAHVQHAKTTLCKRVNILFSKICPC